MTQILLSISLVMLAACVLGLAVYCKHRLEGLRDSVRYHAERQSRHDDYIADLASGIVELRKSMGGLEGDRICDLKKIEALAERVTSLEKTLSDLDISEETARKAMVQMQAFNDGVSAILNYDGSGRKQA